MARATGQSFESVHRAPAHWTLWAWAELEDAERIAGEQRRTEALYQATLMARAFHEPGPLVEQFNARVQRMTQRIDVPDLATMHEAAAELFAWAARREQVM